MNEVRSGCAVRAAIQDEKAAASYAVECRCHKQMGNDFYFLPTGVCLYYAKCENPL